MKLPQLRAWLLLACALLALPTLRADPIRVALYDDAGAAGQGVPKVAEILGRSGQFQVTIFKASDISSALANADIVIFTGGSGSAQGNALGEAGRGEVQRFVRDGGGYVGICAGAYLACSKFSWSLGLLDAQTVSNKWRRGVGSVRMEFTPDGRELAGTSSELYDIKYANGPIMKPAGRSDLAPYLPVSFFRTELAENDTPPGVMVNSPAMMEGTFGKGRVFISSPHPEQTPALENVVTRAASWVAGRSTP